MRAARFFLVLLAASFPVACHRARTERGEIERPPYVVVGADELRVRPDLLGALTFQRASAGGARARVQGFGHVAFAPSSAYAIQSPVAGFVERVHVNVGQEVKAGQSLATLRSGEVARLRAETRRLDVAVKTEEEIASRLEKLVAEGAASARELLDARARIESQRAELAGNRESLAAMGALGGSGERFDLKASAAGRVLARRIAPGEHVSPDGGEPPFLVGDPRRLVVRGSFPERDLPLLADDASCHFTVPALGSSTFEGILRSVVQTVDPKTHAAEAVCIPATTDPRLAADMTAKLEVDVTSGAGVVIPRSAVLIHRDARILFVKAGDEVLRRRTVRLGRTIGDDVEILEGLAPGDDVVVKNAVLLDGELDQVL